MPSVARFDVLASHPEKESLDSVPWRDALYTDEDEPQLAGEVSSGDDYYNIIQYGDILEAIGQGIEARDEDIQPEGEVALSNTRHKMTARIGMGQTVEAAPGDRINLDLRARSGHSGYHGLKFDVGAMREICSNGMMAFVADQSYEQTHSEQFQPGLAYHAVDAVVDGVDTVERRLEQAQERELRNQDEALLILQDIGIDRYLEDPTPDLLTALNEEVEDPDNPSLYETFNAATYALTHLSEDRPQYQLDDGYEQAAQLLEYGEGIPHPDILGEDAVRRRSNQLIEDPEAEEYWEGERESLRDLMEYHEVEA
ncbi:DUF932 domain-containing protein [Haloplanus natans]|uniref:DUF932 domain-containing protein n=1 Tax=Haloplanus natans TaxID=376171 RepID=UPI000677F625|nr:DUF932 domain-containing protein [Haloplanus natans]